MLIKYLGIFLLGFLLFSCGTPPAGWESTDFSSGGDGDGDGDDQPPVETQLFLADVALINQDSTNNWTIDSQSGWCHNPEDGTVSENTIEMNMTSGGFLYSYTYTFEGGTVSGGILAGSYHVEFGIDGIIIGSGDYDYELRFNSDFTSATFYYYYDGVWSDSQWGDISNTGSCE